MVDEVDPWLNGEAHSLLQDPGRPQRSQTRLIDPLNSLVPSSQASRIREHFTRSLITYTHTLVHAKNYKTNGTRTCIWTLNLYNVMLTDLHITSIYLENIGMYA